MWMDNFADEMNTDVIISGLGNPTGQGADGQLTYATGITKYTGLCAFWQLSAGEVYQYDRIGNPSTHKILIDPAKILVTLVASDTALINGKTYQLYLEEDILQMGDVMQMTASIKR